MPYETFLQKAREKFGNKFDYSNVEWKNANTKIEIVCPVHGRYRQLPVSHLAGCGCPKCGRKQGYASHTYTQEEFFEMARKIHGDAYTYEQTEYRGIDTEITVTCPKHGTFTTTPHSFIHAHSGCPKCKRPKLEGIMSAWLKDLQIEYVEQKKFEWLRSVRQLSLDFYLPEYNIGIECQGEQHFTNAFFPGSMRTDYTRGTSRRDRLKYEQCKEHGIRVIYFVDLKTEIPDTYFDTIFKSKEVLQHILKK